MSIPGSRMAHLEIRNLTKRFGAFVALDEVDLSVARGEFLVLLGPSGCGKTTLLRAIAGLERQDAGEITQRGRSLRDLPRCVISASSSSPTRSFPTSPSPRTSPTD